MKHTYKTMEELIEIGKKRKANFNSFDTRKKHSFFANKLSKNKHNEIIHFMITGDDGEMEWFRYWKNKTQGEQK